jgi:AraC-like DNA-binding protein
MPNPRPVMDASIKAERTFSVVVASQWIAGMMECGVSRKAIEDSSHIRTAQLQHQDGRIPLRDFQGLIQCCHERVQDETVALRVGRKADPKTMGILGHILLNCGNLLEVMDITVTYGKLLIDFELALNQKGPVCELIIEPDNGNSFDIDLNPLVRYRAESAFSWMLTAFRHFKSDLTPCDLSFRHSRPGYLGAYREIFKTDVSFNQSANKMAFLKKDLIETCKTPDPYLQKLYKQHAESLLRNLNTPLTLERYVRDIISANLHRRTVDIEMVSRELHTSRWQLSRRLKRRNTSFQKIQEETRFDLAKAYLNNDRLTTGEISERLGYAELSAFTRAFRRWSGVSPREFRRQLENGSEPLQTSRPASK